MARVWGAGLTFHATDRVDVFGDFYQNTKWDGDPTLWTAGLGYGHANLANPGSFRLAAQYVKANRAHISEEQPLMAPMHSTRQLV